MLPGDVWVPWVLYDAGVTGRIVKDTSGNFTAIGTINEEGAHAVGAKVESDRVLLHAGAGRLPVSDSCAALDWFRFV
jgi:hypothetical protein